MSTKYNYDLTKLQNGLDSLDIPYDDDKLDKLISFYEMVVEKNKVMNLTSITEEKDVILKHFADSVALALAVPEIAEKNIKVLDLGTGAGFPGVPLAIAYPEMKLTLVDSLNKRILFIKEEADKLGLKNIRPVHGRAEDLSRDPEFREKNDLCVSRAVANLSTLAEYCIPFVHNGGFFIPYKSGNVDEEIKQSEKALHVLGGKTESICHYSLPEDAGERTLIIIRKEKQTPKKYPRKAGLPSKEPLSERK